MKLSLLQRLLRRSKPAPAVPSLMWQEQRIHERIAQSFDEDPTLCNPATCELSGQLLTAHLTLILDELHLHNDEAIADPGHYWQYDDTIEDRARTALIETALMPSV